MRQLFYSAFTLLTAVVLALVFSAPPAAVAADAPDGQAVFMAEKCNLCHSVNGAGIEAKTKSDKLKGPDLSGYEPPAGFDVSAFVRKQMDKDGESHRREFKGTDEELQALLSWLKSQSAS
jgi:mono/diheme cytochrome c family protein